MKPRKYLVVNSWHDDNKGDSAITLGTLRLIKLADPDAQITVVCLNERGPLADQAMRHVSAEFPDVTTLANPLPTELRGRPRQGGAIRQAGDSALWLTRLLPTAGRLIFGQPPRRLRKLIDECDCVIGVGGANIYDDPSVMPVLSMGRLLSTAAPIRAGLLAGKRTVLLGHTLGPFPRSTGLRLGRALVRGSSLIVTREESSAALARELGAQEVEVAPDMAFAIEPAATARTRALIDALPRSPARTLGVAIRRHPSLGRAADRNLVLQVAEAARALHAAGVIDAVVAVAHTIGPTPIEDDRPITEELAAELREMPLTLLNDDVSPSELAWFYGQLHSVVAVRLHAAILSICAGTPVFAISYFTKKTEGVMAGVGLGDYVADFATVTSAKIIERVTALDADPDLRGVLALGSAKRRGHLEARAADWLLAADQLAGAK